MDIGIGDRVVIRSLTGVVRFLGETEFSPGIWVGIELDEPLGKNDGSVKGVRYFELSAGKRGHMYGIFSKKEGVYKDSRPSSQHVDSNTLKSPVSDSQRLKKIIGKLEVKVHSLKTKCTSLEEELSVRLAEQARLLQLEEQLEKLTLERDEAEQRNDLLISDLESLTAAHESALKELSDCNEEIMIRRKADLDWNEDELTSVDPIAGIKQTKLLTIALQKLQSKFEAIQQQCNDLQYVKNELELDAEKSSQKILSLEETLLETTNSLEELKQQFSANGNSYSIIESLTTENHQMSTELDVLRSELAELRQKQFADEEFEALYKEVEVELNSQIAKLQENISTAESIIAALKKDNETLKSEMESSQKGLRHDTHDLPLQLQELHAELTSLQLQNNELKFLNELSSSKLSHVQLDSKREALSIIKIIYSKDVFAQHKCLEMYKSHFVLFMYYALIKYDIDPGTLKEDINLNALLEKVKRNQPFKLELSLLKKVDIVLTDPRVLFTAIQIFLETSVEKLLSIVKLDSEKLDNAQIRDIYSTFHLISAHITSKLEDMNQFTGTATFDEDLLPIYINFVSSVFCIKENPNALTTCFVELQRIPSQMIPQVEELPTKRNENQTQLESQIQLLSQMISDKDHIIQDLALKIEVLNSKFARNIEMENSLSKLKDELLEVKEKNSGLRNELVMVRKEHQDHQDRVDLEKRNKNILIHTDALNEIILLRENSDKLSLLSEISDLHQIILKEEQKSFLEWSIQPLGTGNKGRSNKDMFADFNDIANILSASVKLSDPSPARNTTSVRKYRLAQLRENYELSLAYADYMLEDH
ncbi:unnamed protein product [Kluyveromyces dobzhanskii CBS 2104]|uniref:WGS project CCBQ000000000 data, contig 00099 n=1 Tax=Kluyveromyces dobzhanskii CBS 2104 TaxID=1427455 RepID=A0A0A8L4U9_9SACH|nr:unnamed protein product [Kluyveromyces dobzhanskii CBS 2104]